MIKDKVKNTYQIGGAKRIIQRIVPFCYREYLRPYLPKRHRVFSLNGILASSGGFCLFDRVVPGFRDTPKITEDNPEYEAALLSALQEQISPGDNVLVIGGGWGVSAVIAAQIAGDSGSITVYEGSQDRIRDIKRTLELNRVDARVSLRHSIVGKPVSILGSKGSTSQLDPTDLPKCDVLEMDCEGSETDIIPRLENDPSTIVVETHRNEQTVISQLEEKGYNITETRVEKPGEIYVLTAEKES